MESVKEQREEKRMRSPEEIHSLIDTLERHNDTLWARLKDDRGSGREFDEISIVFNNNGQLLCALRWVLGEDTIRVQAQTELVSGQITPDPEAERATDGSKQRSA